MSDQAPPYASQQRSRKDRSRLQAARLRRSARASATNAKIIPVSRKYVFQFMTNSAGRTISKRAACVARNDRIAPYAAPRRGGVAARGTATLRLRPIADLRGVCPNIK
jgi:hypothetical protein